jgi:hypothetical protein
MIDPILLWIIEALRRIKGLKKKVICHWSTWWCYLYRINAYWISCLIADGLSITIINLYINYIIRKKYENTFYYFMLSNFLCSSSHASTFNLLFINKKIVTLNLLFEIDKLTTFDTECFYLLKLYEKYTFIRINCTPSVPICKQKFSHFFVPKYKQKTSFLFVLLQKYPSYNYCLEYSLFCLKETV